MDIDKVLSQHIPEVVVDGKSALLAHERDVETLAKHLDYLVGHPDVCGVRWGGLDGSMLRRGMM